MTIAALTYDDLAEITDILTRLFSAEGQGLDLNQQRGAAQGEVATLRGVLEFERERTREQSKRGDHWYRTATAVQGGHCNSTRLVRQAAPRLRVMTGNRVQVRLGSVRRPFRPLSCTGPYRLPYTFMVPSGARPDSVKRVRFYARPQTGNEMIDDVGWAFCRSDLSPCWRSSSP